MSARQLCDALAAAGFDGEDHLDPVSLDWAFLHGDDSLRLLAWICAHLRPANVLSASDLELYEQLELEGKLLEVPPTRAKSPKFTRRKSCSDTPLTPEGGSSSPACCRLHRRSIGDCKDGNSRAQCSPRSSPKNAATTKARPTKSAMKNVGQPGTANAAVQT